MSGINFLRPIVNAFANKPMKRLQKHGTNIKEYFPTKEVLIDLYWEFSFFQFLENEGKIKIYDKVDTVL